ncbi:hypothetical protein H312_03336 [Anncaliia algerae PRA339]|uniref:KEN domain-containing protein n=1 Tax=Anncaliia algerae PRA339 TaxID=1288291 RepID=A0A059EW58_9MICR|nr:hypothetical protein H312_03336 [Anncaliia algerae PRA339]
MNYLMILLFTFIKSLIIVEYDQSIFVFNNDRKFILKKELSSFYPKEITYSNNKNIIKYNNINYKLKEILLVEGENDTLFKPTIDLLSHKTRKDLSFSNKMFIDQLFLKDNYLFYKNNKIIYLDDIHKPFFINDIMILFSKTHEFISFMNVFFVLTKRNVMITDLQSVYKRELSYISINGINECNRMLDRIQGIYFTVKYRGMNVLYTVGTKKKDLLSISRNKREGMINLYYLVIPLLLLVIFIMRDKRVLFYKGINYNLYYSFFKNKRVIIKEYKNKSLYDKEIDILSNESLNLMYLYKRNNSVIFDYYDSFLEGVSNVELYSFELIKLLYSLRNNNLSFTSLDPINLRVKNNKPILLNYDLERIIHYRSKNNLNKEIINKVITKDNDKIDCNKEIINNKLIINDNIHKSQWEEEVIFLFGIIIHQLIYKVHPYNINDLPIEDNIINDNKHSIDKLTPGDFLIRGCLQKKLSLNQLMVHPFFWSPEKRFLFLASLSDVLEKKNNVSFKLFNRLERNKHHIFTNDWIGYLDKEISDDLFSYREYTNTVQGLLRAIRNKGRHYTESSITIKNIYKSFPNGFISYYEEKFNGLIMISYVSGVIVRNEDVLKDFYSFNECI